MQICQQLTNVTNLYFNNYHLHLETEEVMWRASVARRSEANACADTMKTGLLFRLFVILCFCPTGRTKGNSMLGHLQKLGSHRPPEGAVTELDYIPSAKEFHEMYSAAGVPLLMKGAAKQSKAYQLWTDEYLM